MYEEQPAIIDWLFSYKNKIIRNPASNFKSLSQKTQIPTVHFFQVFPEKMIFSEV